MKYIIEWAFKLILTLTFGVMAMAGLQLLSLMLWNKRLFEMSEEVKDLIWKRW